MNTISLTMDATPENLAKVSAMLSTDGWVHSATHHEKTPLAGPETLGKISDLPTSSGPLPGAVVTSSVGDPMTAAQAGLTSEAMADIKSLGETVNAAHAGGAHIPPTTVTEPIPGVDPDKRGVKYDARIHSTPASFKKGDGCYKAKRNVAAELIAQVEAEQKSPLADGGTPPAAPVMTPPPAAPVAEDVPPPLPPVVQVSDRARLVEGVSYLESALLATPGWTQEMIDALPPAIPDIPTQAAVPGRGITIVGDLMKAITEAKIPGETVNAALAQVGIATLPALALAPDKVLEVAVILFPNG